jgi:hypothetical protein
MFLMLEIRSLDELKKKNIVFWDMTLFILVDGYQRQGLISQKTVIFVVGTAQT